MYGGIQPDADARSVCVVAGQFGITLGFGVEGDRLRHFITQADAIDLAQWFIGAVSGIVRRAFLPIVQAKAAMKG